MKVTKVEAKAILDGENPEYKEVQGKTLLDDCNGVTRYKVICKHLNTGKHFAFYYDVGQGIRPYNEDHEEPVIDEVVEKVTMVKKWVPVEKPLG